MRDRLLSVAGGLARLVLVVAAFGLAVGSIGLSVARGFCPEPQEATAHVLALPAFAAVVEDAPVEGGVDVDAPDGDGATSEPGGVDEPDGDAGEDAGDAPASEEPAGEGETGGGVCEGGVQRCLPPLVSSILIIGDTTCHDQAGGELRRILVPAFVGSTALLAGAWWFRPRRSTVATPSS